MGNAAFYGGNTAFYGGNTSISRSKTDVSVCAIGGQMQALRESIMDDFHSTTKMGQVFQPPPKKK